MKRISSVVIISLATALFISQSACSSGNQTNSNANTSVQNSTANTNATAKESAASNQNATAQPGNSNTNTNANANMDANPFTELVMLYSGLFTARMKGNKAKVESLLAEDYRETTGDGKVLNRAQVLTSIDENKEPVPFNLDALKSTVTGDTGVVTGSVKIMSQGKTESWKFSATFRKQQGRWLAVSSKSTDYKKS